MSLLPYNKQRNDVDLFRIKKQRQIIKIICVGEIIPAFPSFSALSEP